MISNYDKVMLLNNIGDLLDSVEVKQPLYNILMTIVQEQALKKVKKIKLIKLNKISDKEFEQKRIVFHSVHSCYLGAIYREAMMAKTLQLLGHDVKMIICGGMLTNCTGVFTVTMKPNKGMCRNCVSFGKKFFDIMGLPYITYCDYLRNINIPEKIPTNVYGIDTFDHVNNSVIRYYRGITRDKDYQKVLDSQLRNAYLATVLAKEVIEKDKPDILVTSHGVYSTWGCFADYFRSKNIPTYVWSRGYTEDTLIFAWDSISDSFNKYFKEIRKEKFLSEKEKEELFGYVINRQEGKEGCSDTEMYKFSKKKINLENQFNFSKYKKTFVLFSNVMWDDSFFNANIVFKNIYDWILYTISIFKENPDYQLLIKVHPADKQKKSSDGIDDFINQKTSLTSNITIIPSDTNISAYSLFPFMEAGIVYNGTIGLELALNEIPVIVAGKTHYGNKDFTYDITSKEQYGELLFGNTSMSVKNKDLARVYAYYYFVKSFVPVKHFKQKSFLNIGWNIKSYQSFLNDKNLIHICDHIINDKIYQDW